MKEVYKDEKYTLGMEDGTPILTVSGKKLRLSCHPYEPCLYITDELGIMTAVHSAFDPSSVIRAFGRGETVTSITGRVYGPLEFCRMVDYASGMVDVTIDYAEKVLGPIKKEEKQKKEKPDLSGGVDYEILGGYVVEDDPFYKVAEEFPDSVVDFCIVKDDMPYNKYNGYESHWRALVWASLKLFCDCGEAVWRYDVGKSSGKQVETSALFAPASKDGPMNFRKAFLYPPYGCDYKNKDFDRLVASLFPKGTDNLTVFEWTTDWSEYFDEGHEWWGALCLTVYDRSLDRFAVIMASASD